MADSEATPNPDDDRGAPTAAITASSAAAWLDNRQPELLAAAIDRYSIIQAAGGWPALPPGLSLGPGMRDSNVRPLRQHLRLSGDYTAEVGADPLLFDRNLSLALMRYQQRHGLTPTGKLDRLTGQALSVPPEQRLIQLLAALEGWQAITPAANGNPTGRHIWVNIPEATVSAIADGQVELLLKAIVGNPSRQTPELSSKVNRVVVNPSWTVPRTIAVNDLLPRQQADPTFFARNRIRVLTGLDENEREIPVAEVPWSKLHSDYFPYRLRQDPGSQNALGAYKFDFPNKYDVYLHDTPMQLLLDLSYRSFSSGCVRVDKAPTFADWLLTGSSGQTQHRKQAGSPTTRSLRLRQAVPIRLVYLTAWVTPADGSVQFRNDIYDRAPMPDDKVIAAEQP